MLELRVDRLLQLQADATEELETEEVPRSASPRDDMPPAVTRRVQYIVCRGVSHPKKI